MTYRVHSQTVSQLHQVFIGFSDLNETFVGQSGYIGNLRSELTGNERLANVVSVKYAARARLWAVLCEITKQPVNLSVRQDGGHPSTGIPEVLDTKTSIAEIWMSCHHGAASIALQVYRVLSDFENLAGFIRAKVRQSSEWTFIVSSEKENRANFAMFQMGNRFYLSFTACTFNTE
jgi:hypothetical protein